MKHFENQAKTREFIGILRAGEEGFPARRAGLRKIPHLKMAEIRSVRFETNCKST